MTDLLIKNAKVILPGAVKEDSCIACEKGKITQVGPSSELGKLSAKSIIDAKGSYLSPGFIDLHIHGTGEYLIDDGSEALASLVRLLPRYGVTGFLPTVCPRPKGEDSKFVSELANVKTKGSSILGFFHEGPFLSITGALPAEALGEADIDRLKSLIEATKPYQATFAISPEFEEIGKLLPVMKENGSLIFLTHTKANVSQTKLAIDMGARHATHFYNVFYSPDPAEIGVRPCGAVEAVLADPRVTVDFVLDGEHFDPVAMKATLNCKGIEGVCLITDANVGAGLSAGRFQFGQHEIEFAYDGAPARFTNAHPEFPGTLAGSGLTMDRAVRNAISMLGVDLPQAVEMASASPARVLGLEKRKGQLAEGYDADMVLLNTSLEPIQTWVMGESCFELNE